MTEAVCQTLSILPQQPGVYLMKDRSDTIIYVGKAKILRNRVRSYFSGRKDTKTGFLVSHIDHIDFIVTGTEYEALILENNLIKAHNPKYNINLKDGKTYPVIRITGEEFPRVFRTRQIIQDGSQYFGPFPAVGAIDRYLELIEEYFPLRKCRGPLKKREQPCLYFHIHRCLGPCAGKTTPREYQRQVRNIRTLLEGQGAKLSAELQKRMQDASKKLQFEEAAKLRDAVRALETVGMDQQVQDFDQDSRDYLSWASDGEMVSFVVFRMRQGKLLGTETFRTVCLPGEPDGSEQAPAAQTTTEKPASASQYSPAVPAELVEQFFLRFYDAGNPPPQRICLAEWPAGREAVEPTAEPAESPQAGLAALARYLDDELGCTSMVKLPQQGRDQAIINLARENARQDLARRKTESGDVQALRDLQSVLGLPGLPMRIEGFDIAHLHGKHTVAAMVSFWKGIPDKNHYRIFQIKSLQGGIDDFESIREAVARRYTRVLNEELERPDLILIDGGKGQLSAACSILEGIGLSDIPVCALAKEEEEIFLPGRNESVRLPEGSPALRILQAVRDESHRFGTGHNQRLRSGDIKLSVLEGIPGIGPGRAKKLMQAYGSLESIRAADAASLQRQGGLPARLAAVVEAALKETAED
jgi:excinuclease ABC subunit C